MNHDDLFKNKESAIRKRDEGIANAEKAAGLEWSRAAYDELRKFLQMHKTMHSDDFWAWANVKFPKEGRALGAVFLRASKNKLMRKSGQYRPSIRSHMADSPVWASLIYQGPMK